MRFRGRLVFKVVSLVFAGVLLFLTGVVALLSSLNRNSRNADAIGCIWALFVPPALIVLKILYNAFSALEMDDTGVRVTKLLHRRSVEWRRIGTVHVWDELIRVRAGTSFEANAELRTPEGKRLLALKNRYDKAAYRALIEMAEARKIPVRRSQP